MCPFMVHPCNVIGAVRPHATSMINVSESQNSIWLMCSDLTQLCPCSHQGSEESVQCDHHTTGLISFTEPSHWNAFCLQQGRIQSPVLLYLCPNRNTFLVSEWLMLGSDIDKDLMLKMLLGTVKLVCVSLIHCY